MASIEEKVENLLKGLIESLGYNLYDVEYAKEGKDYFLRIFIDKEDGIDLEDCEKVNDAISDELDEADYIREQYFLEVSSPGIERILRREEHLSQSIGKKIEAKLFKPLNGEKQVMGILDSFNKESINIKMEQQIIQIDRKNIAQMKTVYDW